MPANVVKRIVLADPRGFCAGVDRAIQTVRMILQTAASSGTFVSTASRAGARRALAGHDIGAGAPAGRKPVELPPVYVRRQIVHNRHVVEDLAARGAVFVDDLGEIPDEAARAGVPIVFSAHGVSPAVEAEAERRHMHIIDATCPLVSKVHREVQRFVREGYEIIYIGHPGHDEAIGVVGESPEHVHLVADAADVGGLDFKPSHKLVVLTQTTLSVDETKGLADALKARFPWIEEPPSSDICYATQNRQTAVKLVAEQVDCMVIVGSANSSNTVRLVEVAEQALGGRGHAHRIDDAGELEDSWLEGVTRVGISSGASVPEDLVNGVVERLEARGFGDVGYVEAVEETMHFVLPSELRR